MYPIRRYAILVTVAAGALSAAAQDDDGLDMDALFEDDFEPETQSASAINDPFEGLNRAIFRFNDGLYRKVVRPFTNVYTKVVPDPVEKGLGNFFENIKFPSRFVSNVLQGRLGQAGKETGKFVVDSTVGVGGILRPSTKIEGLQTSDEDIGQALGRWGIDHGFYFVMPLTGPTSLRDFAADFADDAVEPLPTPWSQVDHSATRNTLRIVEIVNNIPAILDLYDSMLRSAIDPYTSVRDAYAQRRARLVAE